MPKVKFYVRNVSIRMQDHEYKKMMQICYRKKKNKSEIIREILLRGIESMLKKKPTNEH